MKTLLALALLAAAASPALAQSQDDSDLSRTQEIIRKAFEASKSQAAAKKAAAPKKPKVYAKKKRLSDVVDRLRRDGIQGALPGGVETRSYAVDGVPDAKGGFVSNALTLFQKMAPVTSENGRVTYTVLRHDILGLKAESRRFEKLKEGRGRITVWTFHIAPDGEIVGAVRNVAEGPSPADGTVVPDPAQGGVIKQENVEPHAKSALDAWWAFQKVIPWLGIVVEA